MKTNISEFNETNSLDITIQRNNIKTSEDFFNYVEKNKIFSLDQADDIYINELSIIKNYLTTIEFSKILNFTKLNFNNFKYLNFTANELTNIPSEFNSFINLEILILNNNKIKIIENLENIKTLKRLEMRANKILKFENLSNKPNLEYLSVSCNFLTKINIEECDDLFNLKELGLFGNYLGK